MFYGIQIQSIQILTSRILLHVIQILTSGIQIQAIQKLTSGILLHVHNLNPGMWYGIQIQTIQILTSGIQIQAIQNLTSGILLHAIQILTCGKVSRSRQFKS